MLRSMKNYVLSYNIKSPIYLAMVNALLSSMKRFLRLENFPFFA